MKQRYPEDSTAATVSPKVIATWEGARLRAFGTILTYIREHGSDHSHLEIELDNAIGLIDWGLIYGPDEVSPIRHPGFAEELQELIDKVGDMLLNCLSGSLAKISTGERELKGMTTQLEEEFKLEIDERHQRLDAAHKELYGEVLPAIEEWKRLAADMDSPQAVAQFMEQYLQLTRRMVELEQIFKTTEAELVAIQGAMEKHRTLATKTMVKAEADQHQMVDLSSDMNYLTARWQHELPKFTERWLSRWQLEQEHKRALPWWEVLIGRTLSWAIDVYYRLKAKFTPLQ